MTRLSGLVVFLGIVLTLLAGLHYYLWARLIRDPNLPQPWRIVATVALIVAGASIPLSLFLRRASPATLSILIWPAFIWLGVMFLLVVTFAAVDLVRISLSLAQRVSGAGPIDPARRLFFARWIAGGTLALATGAGVAGIGAVLRPVGVRRVEVSLNRLRRQQDGLTLVQLTDLHIGPTIGKSALAELVERTNALQPDIVAITGDLVDGSVGELRDAVSPLGRLKAKQGVFFVTGNHEYFSGAVAWIEELSRLGIRVLRNERVTIGEGEGSLYLAGVDDRSAARSTSAPGHGEDLEKALGGRDLTRPIVLLAHQPRTVLDAAKYGVDLQLSGHTHGGQIWPFGALVRLQQHFLAGLSRHGDTFIYVSRGTGYWGPPMRLFAPAEITHIVLRSATA